MHVGENVVTIAKGMAIEVEPTPAPSFTAEELLRSVLDYRAAQATLCAKRSL